MHKHKLGFTIIEIMIVIVILGVLAVIGYVSFNGVQRHTNNETKSAQIAAISEALEKYHEENGEYPSCEQMASDTSGDIFGIDQSLFVAPGAPTGTLNSFIDDCGDFSDDGYYDEFVYDGEGPCSIYSSSPCYEFGLDYYYEGDEGDGDEIIEEVSDEIMTDEEVGQYIDCDDEVGQTGYIPIPGSKTYGTKSFCVMKYEAKKVSETATSQASDTPWVNIDQNEAIKESQNVCNGCHLITENEWMTIAQNALNVDSNWEGGTIGDGYIYQGHSDNDPSSILEASDNDGYYLTGDQSPSSQKRTLNLSNDQIIWDLAGNVSEWTDGTISGRQPYTIAGDTGYLAREWKDVQIIDSIYPDPSPAGTRILNASNWTADINKIGNIRSNSQENTKKGFVRGSYYNGDLRSGILCLDLSVSPTEKIDYLGFRVTK